MSLSVLRSPAVRWAAGGWSFFIAENALLSENRTWLIQELGDEPYHLVYGTLSTVATASIGYAYYSILKTKVSPALAMNPRSSLTMVGGWIFLSIGTILASQTAPKMQIPFSLIDKSTTATTTTTSESPFTSKSLQVRCPFDFSDKKVALDSIHGVERITRHPGLWSLGFVGLGQAILAPTIPQKIWWCGPAAVALLGGSHTDSRFRRGMGGTLSPEYECQTSNLPFWAIASGKQGSNAWQSMIEDIKPSNALAAIGATALWVLRRVVR